MALKRLAFFALLVLTAFLANSQTGYAADSDFDNYTIAIGLQSSILNQVPDPARPGDIVDVRLQLENTGRHGLRNVAIRIEPKYPLKAFGSTEEIIPYIGPRQESPYAQTVKFKMAVDSAAVDGAAEFDVFFGNNQTGYKQAFTIDVDALEGNVIVTQFHSAPSRIVPGKESAITFEIFNNAKASAKDISLALNFSSDKIPLAASRISSTQRINSMGPGEKSNITYYLTAFPDATPGTYKVPVTLKFTNENETVVTVNDYFGFVVGDVPDIQATIDSTEIYKSGESGEVAIRFSNKGVSDVKFLNVELIETNGVTALSAEKVYVGQLDSDDFETATFRIYVKNKEDAAPISMKIEYMDSTNQKYEETIQVPLRLYDSGDISKYELRESSSASIWIVIVIVAIAGAWYWRRKQR
jgi:hypothetical protein